MKRFVAIAALGAALTTQAAAAPGITSALETAPAAACQPLPSGAARSVASGVRTSDLRVQVEPPALTLSAARLQAIRIGAPHP